MLQIIISLYQLRRYLNIMSRSNLHRTEPISEDYNNFFHPNLCHVCKSKNQGKLKLCICYMISYCCEEHRIQHRSQHKEICEIIVNTSKQKNIWNTRFMTVEGWAQFKMANMQYIKQKLRRNLEPYEEQMFLFAKSCIICRKQDNLIVSCSICVSINVCNDHVSTPFDHTCILLGHNLNLEMYNMWHKENDNIIPEKLLYINKTNVYNMLSFIQENMQHDRVQISWVYSDYIYTDIFSAPLTLFYGMQDANLLHLLQCSFFIVHIITGNIIDKQRLLAWEIILHELCPNTKLQIVMVGPELQEIYYTMQVCNNCVNNNKIFQYECHRMLYYNFANSMHMRPDIILGFDIELKNKETSVQIIKAIQRQRCPLILTSKSECKTQENITEIQNILKLPLMPIIAKKNAFASCRPYRNYEDYSVFFPNNHLIIYSNLTVIENSNKDENKIDPSYILFTIVLLQL